MRFTKMHGLGNDYVYVNGFAEHVENPAALAVPISNRHTGVGGDGLILILPSQVADVRMRMFNADGSEAEMCGNGVRCVAKYAFDHGLSRNNPMTVETGRGVLSLGLTTTANGVTQVTVNMGHPITDPAHVPVDVEKLTPTGDGEHAVRPVPGEPPLVASFVSMGNPHAVIFTPDVRAIDLPKIGPLLERHPAFPNRMNVHFVQVLDRGEVIMRTWERGSGITQACGTGACAVAVAGALTGRTRRNLLAHLPGGDLELRWDIADNNVYMTGPAVEVFSGDWNE